MATARLIPSILYNYAGTSYLTVTDADNAYTNTDSTTYATIQNISSSTSSRYIYLRGFNFSSVPDDAIVSSISIKIKAYHSGGNTSTIYGYNGTTQVSSAGSTTALGTSASVKTFTNTTISWDTLKGYGDNFGIRINCRRSNKNNTAYIYIYGAEIDVEYTVPVYHNVSVSGTDVSPSGTTSVLEGSSLTVKAYQDSKPTVTDNNVDVTSQLVQATESGASYTVTNVTTTYGFALNSNDYYESNNKAHASSAAVCRVDFVLPVAATITFSLINYAESTYDYGLLSNIDTTLNTNASADTSNVYWNGKNNNSASVQTVTYSNVTAGNHYIYVKYFKDSYTDSNNDSLQFKVAITLNEPYTPRTYWGYTLTNITTDHTIVITTASSDKIYYKADSIETMVGSDTSSNYDDHQIYVTLENEVIVPGDTVHVVLTNVRGWQSGAVRISGNFEITFVRTATYGYGIDNAQIAYLNDQSSNIGIRINQGNSSSDLTMQPYYLYLGTSPCEFDGTITVYKQASGGWIEALKVYKKVSGSWVEQNDLTTVFSSNINYVKG